MIGVAGAVALGLALSAGVYQPPTTAPVTDPFRPPPKPWMAGNRGIEYGTSPGSAVVAIGTGRVAFVGPVAGRLVVSIVHPDGLRSTYTWLSATLVRRGQAIRGGEPVGVAGERLHLGVRLGRTYLDPTSLWGRSRPPGRPLLVPHGPRRARAPPTLGLPSPGHYTDPSVHRPVDRCPTRLLPPNGRCQGSLAVLGKRASKKPLERSGS